jgi:hypothetical protein
VISKNLKLILIIRHDNSRTYELYDLEKDPRERNNLIAGLRYKTKVDLLKAMMDDWTQKVDLKLDLYKIEDTVNELSPETLEQLKSLGYIN